MSEAMDNFQETFWQIAEDCDMSEVAQSVPSAEQEAVMLEELIDRGELTPREAANLWLGVHYD